MEGLKTSEKSKSRHGGRDSVIDFEVRVVAAAECYWMVMKRWL